MSQDAGGQARGASTVFDVVAALKDEGYTGDLYAEEGGGIRCGACDQVSPAGNVDVAEVHRLEGASDPADMAAVVAAPCPACGAKGTMVVMYGPEASGADADVLAQLPTPATPEERPGTDG